jgi:hypothetical protein
VCLGIPGKLIEAVEVEVREVEAGVGGEESNSDSLGLFRVSCECEGEANKLLNDSGSNATSKEYMPNTTALKQIMII